MPRKIPTPKADANAGQLRRRFRQVELRLAISAEPARAAVEQLHRDAASVDDPAERLTMVESAYLSVFPHTPQEYGRRSEVVQ